MKKHFPLIPAVVVVFVWTVSAQASLVQLFVASGGSNQVLRYDGVTGAFQTIAAASSSGLNLPTGMTIGGNGDLFVNSYSGRTTKEYNITTNTYVGDFVNPTTAVNPLGIIYDPARTRYYESGDLRNAIDIYSTAGGASTGTLTGLGVGGRRIVIGPDGRLYGTSNQPANNVWAYNFTTSTLTGFTASGDGAMNGAVGLTFGPDGNLYVASYNTNKIEKFNGTTGAFISDFATTNLNNPEDLDFGPDGNLYVASRTSNTIVRFNGSTGAFIDNFVTAGSGGLSGPQDLLFVWVPEPASLGLLAVAGAMLLGRRRS